MRRALYLATCTALLLLSGPKTALAEARPKTAAKACKAPPPDKVVCRDADGLDCLMRVQVQVLFLGSLGPVGDDFGGLEFQINVSAYSLGLALGFAYDRVQTPHPGGPRLNGGHAQLAIQWRPLHLLAWRAAYRYVDLHGDLGFVAGGLQQDGRSRWWGRVYVGAGLDVAIPLHAMREGNTKSLRKRGIPNKFQYQLVLTVQYRHNLAQSIGTAPGQELLVGLGVRGLL